jgi:tetratricopeptide (TPR) repeat protein
MGFFSRFFGSNVTAAKDSATAADQEAGNAFDRAVEKAAAEQQGTNFVSTLLMHVRGDLEPALAAYQRILEETPEDHLALFLVAVIDAAQGRTAAAVESLRHLSRQISLAGDSPSRAILLELIEQIRDRPILKVPDLAEVVVSFAGQLKEEGYLQESAVGLEIAAGLAPDNAHVLHKLGDTLHDLRMYEYAEAVLQEALKCAPNHWESLYTYAVLLQDLGRDAEAVDYYEKAVVFNPDHVNCHNNYGAALLRLGRLDEALAQCTLAAELDPSSPFVKVNLGNIYLLMQEYESARTNFSEAISLNGNLAPAYFGLGFVEQSQGSHPEKVKPLYLKAVEINPSIAEVHHALGNLFVEESDPEALKHFWAAAHLNNNLKNLHRDFSNACLQLGQREEALEHLRTALQQDPDDAMAKEMLKKVEAEHPVE